MRATLGYMREHRKWVSYHEKEQHDCGDVAPAPLFKDCDNCPTGKAVEDEQERRAVCNPCTLQEACEYSNFPSGPPLAFLQASVLASLPEPVLARGVEQGRISVPRMLDIAAIKEHRQGVF